MDVIALPAAYPTQLLRKLRLFLPIPALVTFLTTLTPRLESQCDVTKRFMTSVMLGSDWQIWLLRLTGPTWLSPFAGFVLGTLSCLNV